MYHPAISVIIPAYNEEASISHQIDAVRSVLTQEDFIYEIVVVDDGSTDRTADVAQRTGVRLIRNLENRGYGASLKTGILAAQHETIVIIDADGTYPAEEIPNLVAELEYADMVVGARTGEKVHVPLIRQPAKWFLRQMAALIAERPIPDLNSGLRAFHRECVKQYFPVLSNRFSFTTTVTLAYLADDYRVVYLPINYFTRVGRSKIVPWHFMDFIVLILRMSMIFNPLKVFVPQALFFGSLGVIKVLFDLWAGFARNPGVGWSVLLQPVFSTSALLLLFVGLQFMMIGIMADGIIRRIAQHSRPLIPSRARLSVETEAPLLIKEQEYVHEAE